MYPNVFLANIIMGFCKNMCQKQGHSACVGAMLRWWKIFPNESNGPGHHHGTRYVKTASFEPSDSTSVLVFMVQGCDMSIKKDVIFERGLKEVFSPFP